MNNNLFNLTPNKSILVFIDSTLKPQFATVNGVYKYLEPINKVFAGYSSKFEREYPTINDDEYFKGYSG